MLAALPAGVWQRVCACVRCVCDCMCSSICPRCPPHTSPPPPTPTPTPKTNTHLPTCPLTHPSNIHFGQVYLAKYHEVLVAVKLLVDTSSPDMVVPVSSPLMQDLHQVGRGTSSCRG